MSETYTPSDLGAKLRVWAQRAARAFGRIGFGLAVLVAIGIALVATTFIGVLLVIAAVFLTLTRKRKSRSASPQGPEQTIDARRVGDGWVIERGGAWR